MAELLIFPGKDAEPATEAVLQGAIDADLDEVFILGWTKEGEPYLAATSGTGADLLWMLENAKFTILKAAHEEI